MARFSLPLLVCALVAAATADGLAQSDAAMTMTETAPPEESAEKLPRKPQSDPTALRGPVDEARYVVGPGDQLLVVIWGKSTVSHTVLVGPEGELVLPGLAPLSVAGLTLREAKARIETGLGDIYRNVEISVSLSAVRTMRVSVLGNVLLPGEYTGTALDLAGEMIELAGGLGEGASERNISIRRGGGGFDRVDLVRYRNTGDMDTNPPILDGDVVFVPNAVAFVTVDGGVSWPGTYELGPGDTVGDLLEIAGGFARGAVRDTVLLRRFVDNRTTRSVSVDASDPESLRMPLSDGDQVYVRSVTEWRESQRVFIEGEVVHPGPYGINEGVDRLSQVIRRAGGLTEKASIRDARIIRETDPDDIDLSFEWLSGVPVRDMGETERAYWKSRTQDEPGTVVSDLGRALAGDDRHDVLLMDGDLIQIPRTSLTVRVGGQVASPGFVTYVPGKNYAYYIRAAGGYESGARSNAVKVIRGMNGEWVPARRAGELEPGEEVWVPERREGAVWRMIREVATFAASVATAYLLIDQATQ